MLLQQKKPINGYVLSFLLCFATAVALFLPFVIADKGFFLYCGDFNSQQIPFYSYCHDFIKSGGGTFSWATDLGSGLLPTYSFYLLGSPAFWLSLVFPNNIIPFLMAPLLCIKFAVSGVAVYAFANRYLKTRNHSLLAAVLYTFSGFSIYNIFFNHFIEPIMLFPFLLWAMDAFFYDKKRGIFSVFVALNLLNSFFFFSGQVVFCVIYFVVKIICKEWKFDTKEFLLFIFEGIIGVLIGAFLALPTALTLLQNPRTVKFSDGMDLALYGQTQQYFAILSSLFLPPDPPYMPNLFTKGAIKWTSLSAYLPLCSFAGVLCYLKNFKKTVFSRILIICFVMAMVPILNSAFYCFNSSYYARWFYMPLLIMAVATAIVLKDAKSADIKKSIIITGIITSVYLVFTLLPNNTIDEETSEEIFKLGVAENTAGLVLSVLIAVIGLLLFYVVIKTIKSRPKAICVLVGCIMGFSVFYGVLHMAIGKFPQWENDAEYKQQTYIEKNELLQVLENDQFYRLDTYECYENMGLILNIPCIQAFNSTVSPSIMKFYPSVSVKRDVSSKPDYDLYALRGLLSVKYLVLPQDKAEDYFAKTTGEGFVAIADTTSYTVFENENFVPMGFAYDYYITNKDTENIPKTILSNTFLRAILLSDKQVEKYGKYMQPLPQDYHTAFSYETYVKDCNNRRQMATSSFVDDNYGFTAEITLPTTNLVFFSVPYDKGFAATVNGKQVEVEDVSNGMIAILCEKGDNQISLRYTPQGYTIGFICSISGIVILVGYIIANKIFLKAERTPKRKEIE